jgi:hypothetical protein
MKTMRAILAGAALLLAFVCAAPAVAQQVEIAVPSPQRHREPAVLPPGDHYQATRPSDDYYPPPGQRVRYDPAFIATLSVKTESPAGTGRAGVAGWTSPNTPVGAAQTGHRELNGWFALGVAVEWGGPPPPVKRPAANGSPAQRSRAR